MQTAVPNEVEASSEAGELREKKHFTKDRQAEEELKITRWNIFTAKWFQIILGVPARIIFKFFIHLSPVGRENLLKTTGKGIIFAPNHTGELDALVVRSAMPFFSKVAPLFFVSRVPEYYKDMSSFRKHLYGGDFFRFGGAYPAYQGQKDYSRSLRNHINLLKQGKSVLIFPEGRMSQSGELGKARGGLGYLSHQLRLPVIPVLIEGTHKIGFWNFILRRRTVRVVFGEPLSPEELFTPEKLERELTPEEYQKAGEKVLDKIRKL